MRSGWQLPALPVRLFTYVRTCVQGAAGVHFLRGLHDASLVAIVVHLRYLLPYMQ